MGKSPDKDAAGHVDLDVKGLGIGVGNLKLVPGGFEVADPIKLGDLKGRIPIKQGQGTIEVLKLEGAPDVEAEVQGSLTVKPKVQLSRLDADGWFRPTTAFLDKHPKMKSLLELGEKLTLPGAPSLAKAKDDEGRYYFTARGALASLHPTLAKDAGRKAKGRSAKGTPVPVSPSGRDDEGADKPD
jgi:type II secretion system protein N